MGCLSSKDAVNSDKVENGQKKEVVEKPQQENKEDNNKKESVDQQNIKTEEIKKTTPQETPQQDTPTIQIPLPAADQERKSDVHTPSKAEIKKDDVNKRKHTHHHEKKNSITKEKRKDSKTRKASDYKKSIKKEKDKKEGDKKDEKPPSPKKKAEEKPPLPNKKDEEKPNIEEEKPKEEEETKGKTTPKIITEEIDSPINIGIGKPPLSNRNLPHPIPPVIPTPKTRRQSLDTNENSSFSISSSEPIPHFNSTGSNDGTATAAAGSGYTLRGQFKKGISPSQMKKVVHRPESMNLDSNEIKQHVLSMSKSSETTRTKLPPTTPPKSPNNNNSKKEYKLSPSTESSSTNLNPEMKPITIPPLSPETHRMRPPLPPSSASPALVPSAPDNHVLSSLPDIPLQPPVDSPSTPTRRFRRVVDSMKFAESCVTPAKPEEIVEIKQQQVYAHFTSYYTLGKLIGGGNFGKVYKGFRNIDCLNVAVKVIPIQAGFNMTMIQREVDITTSLSHPNLEKCYGVFADQKYLYIVNELIAGGELLTEINRIKIFPIDRVKVIFITIGKAILYCHKQKVIHRDIKPENILYGISNDDTTLKLIDFGFAKAMNGQKTQAVCGTPEYIAPEVISNKPYDEKADIWSLGVIAFLLITGRLPFPNVNGNTNVMFNYIKSGAYEFKEKIWENNSFAKYFVQKCLQVDPSHRFDALELMQSPFLTSHPDYLELTKYEEYLPKYNSIRHGSQFGSSLVPEDVETLYEFQEIIGFGSVGCVYRAQLYTANYNGEYDVKAIKVIKRDLIQNHYQGFIKDIGEQLRGYFKSDNITKVYQIQETVDYLYIVEDFIPFENSLIACLCLRNTYTQYDVVCIICYIISTLIADNNTGSDYVYVHKNIKPDNIFLMDPDDLRTIMLTDYNISQDYFLSADKYRNIKYEDGYQSDEDDHFQSLDFLPPEYFDHKRLSSPCDIWSIGVLTYFLISGYLPFSSGKSTCDTIHTMFRGIGDEYFSNEFWQSIAPECKNFICHCLYVNPNSRMSIQEASNHPFLTNTLLDVNLDSVIPIFKQYQGDREIQKTYHNQYKQENYFTFITN